MKFIERILLAALIIVAAAIVINGYIEHAKPEQKEAPPPAETPLEKQDEAPKAPEQKLPDNMEEAIFIAKDDASMKKSLADFQAQLSKDHYDKIMTIFMGKHKIASGQDESGVLQLQFPSTLALKTFDGKSAKEILESENK